MPRKKKENPDDEITFTFRLSRAMRDSFNVACKSQDTTSSRELRAYIRGYIAKNGQGKLI